MNNARAWWLMMLVFAWGCLEPLPLSRYTYSCTKDADCGDGQCVNQVCHGTVNSTGGGSATGGGNFALGGGFGVGGGGSLPVNCSTATDCGANNCCSILSAVGLCAASGASCILGGICNPTTRRCE